MSYNISEEIDKTSHELYDLMNVRITDLHSAIDMNTKVCNMYRTYCNINVEVLPKLDKAYALLRRLTNLYQQQLARQM